MKNRLTIIFSSFFYLGYSPFAPGTAGTLGAVPLYLLMIHFLQGPSYLLASVLFIAFSIFISFRAVGFYQKSDPGEIVIDEVAGYLVAMTFISPTLLNIVLGFLLFRFFDIVKPFPTRQLEALRGGYGIVLDDVAAGMWTNISLLLINSYIIN